MFKCMLLTPEIPYDAVLIQVNPLKSIRIVLAYFQLNTNLKMQLLASVLHLTANTARHVLKKYRPHETNNPTFKAVYRFISVQKFSY